MLTIYRVLRVFVLPNILENTYGACIAATLSRATSRKVPAGVHVLTSWTCWTDQNLMHMLTSMHTIRYA